MSGADRAGKVLRMGRGTAGRVLGVRAGEGRAVVIVTTLLFVTMAAETIGESGVNALFFENVGADRLPTMYMLQAAGVFLAMLMLAVLLGRSRPRTAYLLLPAATAIAVVAERAVLASSPAWIYDALWVTVPVALLLQGVFLWGIAGLVTDTRQAKRLFPIFGAGGILGAVVGGLITSPLAAVIGAEQLLVVWAGGLVIAVALVWAVTRTHTPAAGLPAPRPTARRATDRSGLGRLLRSRLLVAMTIASVLFSVLFYLLYLPYAQAAADRFPDADELAGFFGLFWAGVTFVALLVSLLLTNRLLGRFGVVAAVLVLPVLYVVAFGLVAVTSAFASLVAIRFVMGVWLQAVASPAWESLINVTPSVQRDRVRAFLNGGPTQIGTALAGVVGLVGGAALSGRALAVVGVVLAIVTVGVAWVIRGSYTAALVFALRVGRPVVFDQVVREAPIVLSDGGTKDALIAAAGSEEAELRRVAVALLPRDEPQARRIFSERIDDIDPRVAALAAAAALGGPGDERALFALQRALEDEDGDVRAETVRALAGAEPLAAVPLAVPMLDDPVPVVRAEAARTLAVHGDPRGLEHALALLGRDAGARGAAIDAVELVGDRAIEPLLVGLDADPLGRDLLDALARVDAGDHADRVERFARARAVQAGEDADRARHGDAGVWGRLLDEALVDRGRRHARAAFLAVAALSEGSSTIRAAVDGLEAADAADRANALEALETVSRPHLGATASRALVDLWESRARADGEGDVESLLDDPDPLISALAGQVRLERSHPDEAKEASVRTNVTTALERMLALRPVPLLADLAPHDLQAVAQVAQDHTFAAGEHLAEEGEVGDRLHLIVRGAVRVERGLPPRTLAVRGEGEVVGELSLVSRAPRLATLVAEGETRTISLARPEFESIIRERPDVALSVMRVLAERVGESTGEAADA